MTMTESELRQIVADATYLSEQLKTKPVEGNLISEPQKTDEIINHWCQIVAQGNWEKFHKRLLWNGIDPQEIPSALSTPPIVPNVLPKWAEILTEIIQTTSDLVKNEQSQTTFLNRWKQAKSNFPFDAENPRPFEDLLLPSLWVGRRRLYDHLQSQFNITDSELSKIISETAKSNLERSLLQRLVNICGKTLDFEFSTWKTAQQTLTNLIVETPQNSVKKTLYNAFIEKTSKEILALFQKYPVLGRIIGTTIDFWVKSTGEFLQGLYSDLSAIQQLFIDTKSEKLIVNKVIEIKTGLSDGHNQGRSVISLTFESGLKLIYKPKDLGLDQAYNQLLTWCNQQWQQKYAQSSTSEFLDFKITKILNRGHYGWVEYIEQKPCENEISAHNFYQRSGILLCLLYVLRANDCHHENLIAQGEYPVLIDMETLMHNEVNPIEDSETILSKTTINQMVADSVLRIGMLPNWAFNKDNRIAYDVSGLGSVEAQKIATRVRQWQEINTDDMHLAYQTLTISVDKNVPILNGVNLSPNDYVDDIVQGFNQMYHFLLEKKQVLLADNSPLKLFQNQNVRFIFRATRIYGLVLQKSLTPQALGKGINRSIQLDLLSRAFLTTQEKPKIWPILHSEIQAMEQLDIPYFTSSSDSNDLLILDSPITGYFTGASYSQVISKITLLNQADLAQQVAIIRGAFYARIARTSLIDPEETSTFYVKNTDIKPLTPPELVNQALQIATEIHNRAIREESGGVNWMGLQYVPTAERFQFQILDHSLYSGNCGIALFLAGWERVTGDSQFRSLTQGAVQSLTQLLFSLDTDARKLFIRRLGLGGATGVGSIIYCWVKIGQLLSDHSYIQNALRMASFITPELIKADKSLDVISGAAGTILGLLALYGETGDRSVLELAIACGQHLLASQISVDQAPRAWTNFSPQPLTGFSHGAAGIALALLRLYAVTQDTAYLEAAREGIAYESHVFSSVSGNWPDFRSIFNAQNNQIKFPVSWCHGATGIGLARLGGLSILEDTLQDVEIALQTTLNANFQELAHLCCGQFGRIELLLVAAEKLGRESLLDTAQLWAALSVAQAQPSGFKIFPNLPNNPFSPGFFQGNAGIGYELLRLAKPGILPSVLIWE
jgi:type 2 lantibiotic biosynthesis protein LanM